MENPFSKEQIKNYLLLYGAIVLIMILFYWLSTLLHEPKTYEKKIFDNNISVTEGQVSSPAEDAHQNETETTHFKLLDRSY